MKKLLLVLALGVAFVSCKSGENTEATTDSSAVVAPSTDSSAVDSSAISADSSKVDSSATTH